MELVEGVEDHLGPGELPGIRAVEVEHPAQVPADVHRLADQLPVVLQGRHLPVRHGCNR